MNLRLSQAQAAAIRAHAAEGYPSEICGILVGAGNEVRELRRAANLNTERAQDRYQLDPAEQLKAEKEARAAGLQVLGFYHSHPDHPAQASATDSAQSWEGYVYLIVSVTAQGAGDLNAFAKRGGSLLPSALEITA